MNETGLIKFLIEPEMAKFELLSECELLRKPNFVICGVRVCGVSGSVSVSLRCMRNRKMYYTLVPIYITRGGA